MRRSDRRTILGSFFGAKVVFAFSVQYPKKEVSVPFLCRTKTSAKHPLLSGQDMRTYFCPAHAGVFVVVAITVQGEPGTFESRPCGVFLGQKAKLPRVHALFLMCCGPVAFVLVASCVGGYMEAWTIFWHFWCSQNLRA